MHQGEEKQFYIRTTTDGKKPKDARAQDHDEIYQLVPHKQDSIHALEDLLNRSGKPADYPRLENGVEANRVLQFIKTGVDSHFEREAEGGQDAGYDEVAAQSSDQGCEEGDSVGGPSPTKQAHFQDEIVQMMRKLCGNNPENWTTSAEIMRSFKREGDFWLRWEAAGFDYRQLVNKIHAMRKREKAATQTKWRSDGSEYLGKRVRRYVYDSSQRPIDCADGVVVGWLDNDESDFFPDGSNVPAALWRVQYDDTRIGSEDLEEYEVKEAMELLSREQDARIKASPLESLDDSECLSQTCESLDCLPDVVTCGFS